jgi:hypothetical protein
MGGVPLDAFEKDGIDVERPQPGFDLITKRHGREGPEGKGQYARRYGRS